MTDNMISIVPAVKPTRLFSNRVGSMRNRTPRFSTQTHPKIHKALRNLRPLEYLRLTKFFCFTLNVPSSFRMNWIIGLIFLILPPHNLAQGSHSFHSSSSKLRLFTACSRLLSSIPTIYRTWYKYVMKNILQKPYFKFFQPRNRLLI